MAAHFSHLFKRHSAVSSEDLEEKKSTFDNFEDIFGPVESSVSPSIATSSSFGAPASSAEGEVSRARIAGTGSPPRTEVERVPAGSPLAKWQERKPIFSPEPQITGLQKSSRSSAVIGDPVIAAF